MGIYYRIGPLDGRLLRMTCGHCEEIVTQNTQPKTFYGCTVTYNFEGNWSYCEYASVSVCRRRRGFYHFLTINPDVGVPEIDYDLNDTEYKPQDCSADKLIKVWKKGQKMLEYVLADMAWWIFAQFKRKNSQN